MTYHITGFSPGSPNTPPTLFLADEDGIGLAIPLCADCTLGFFLSIAQGSNAALAILADDKTTPKMPDAVLAVGDMLRDLGNGR